MTTSVCVENMTWNCPDIWLPSQLLQLISRVRISGKEWYCDGRSGPYGEQSRGISEFSRDSLFSEISFYQFSSRPKPFK